MIHDPERKTYTIYSHTFLQYYFATKEDRTDLADRLIQQLASNDIDHIQGISLRILLNQCKTVPGYLLNEDNNINMVDSRCVELIRSNKKYEIV